MSKFSPENVTVQKLRHLSRGYYSLRLGPCSKVGQCRPGQFVHLGLPEREIYFRRAMSIAAVDETRAEAEIIFKVFGRGTTIMAKYRRGDEVNLLGPLGTGFAKPRAKELAVMVGGGVGFPPLLFLASRLIEQGRDPKSIVFFYGGRTSGEIVERARIRKLGVRFYPVTDDGSFGAKGLVTEQVEKFLTESEGEKHRLYACGPEPMLQATNALALRLGVPGQVSLEAPMPCGFGVCLGCVVELVGGGHARVCQEGPVFDIGEVAL
jgi:dihydroorotate dehydrogenase electron transfer subunit